MTSERDVRACRPGVQAMDRRAVPLAAVLSRPEGTAAVRPQPEPDRPADALAELQAGNRRFVTGQPWYGHHRAGAVAAAGDQQPFAAVLGCIDSRVPVEAVLDQGFGAVFVVRSAGQVLDQAVLGSIEFAVVDGAVPLVLVLGHTSCRAVAATVDALRNGVRPEGARGHLVEQIAPAVQAVGDPPDHTAAVRHHVRRTALRLREWEPVRSRVGTGALAVRGAVYHLDTCEVELLP